MTVTTRKKSKRIYPHLETACFEVKCKGLFPCLALVTEYHKSWAGTYWEPPEPAVVYFELYDRKGYRAVWLEDRLTEEQYEEIECLLLKELEG